MEKPIVFENRNHQKLFGIVHIPDKLRENDSRTGVNLLNPGIKYRVAPNRLNVKIARKLCHEGFFVLRFDPSGIGDSESELPHGVMVPDIWEEIQKGRFVDDTLISNQIFAQKYGLDSTILAGNCGGAITALLASEIDHSVDGLCLIDIPVNLRAANMSFADKVAEGGEKAEWLFTQYKKRIFSPTSWFRLITAKTNYRALLKTVNMRIKTKLFQHNNEDSLSLKVEKLCNKGMLNPLFFKAFKAYSAKQKPLLFILAGNDSGTEIFEHYFQKVYLDSSAKDFHADLYEVFLIENANHVYTLVEWQNALINKICQWIKVHF
jgi:hypothetical protein